MKILSIVRLLALASLVLLAGCGGGGNVGSSGIGQVGSLTSGRSGQLSFTVQWPSPSRSTRSRLIPAASNSIVVTLSQGATQVATQTLSRPASGSTASATMSNLAPGAYSLTAIAYPNANGLGTAQAQSTSGITVISGQTVPVSLTLASTIDHLEVGPTSVSTQVGSSSQLTAVAKDASGNFVLTSALQWTVSNTNIASTDQTGKITGVSVGTTQATVTETESGKSASVPITVSPSTIILYDGFNYPSGSAVSGQNGGTGNFGGAWNEYGQGETASVIASSGLTYSNLATGGNAIMTTSDFPVGHARRFQTSPGKTGGVLFISFLVKPLDALNVGYPSSYFGLAYGGVSVGYGSGSPYYVLDNDGGGSRFPSKVPVVTNQTVFLVMRITFGAANQNDTVDLFVNPTPGQPLPAIPDATKSDRNTGTPADFNFGSSIRCIFDEIRFGRTFQDVSPTS